MPDPQPDADPTAADVRTPQGAAIVPEYFVPVGAKLVTLQMMPPLEAELARAKLEAEGIVCLTANDNMARFNPLWNIPVRLQVADVDLERAREILARPPEPPASDDEYADEEWRCRQCRRKTLDFLPLTPARRRLRDTWVVLLLLPFVWWLIPFDQAFHIPDAAKSWGQIAWVVAVMTLAVLLVIGKRGVRCRECGWTKPA